MKLAPRCSSTDEEVFGKEKTLPLPLFPEREGAQADLAENATFTAGWQLDQRAWRVTGGGTGKNERSVTGGEKRKGDGGAHLV